MVRSSLTLRVLCVLHVWLNVAGLNMTKERPVRHSKSSKSRRTRVRSSLYKFTLNDVQSLIELRKRLRKMSDTELHRFVQALQHMCSPGTNLGQSPRESFVIHQREAQEEWARRNRELPVSKSLKEVEVLECKGQPIMVTKDSLRKAQTAHGTIPGTSVTGNNPS